MKTRRPFPALVLLALVGGCAEPVDPVRSTTDPPPDPSSSAEPARTACSPQRTGGYSVCGKLSATGLQPPTEGMWVKGSVDTKLDDVDGTRYRLNGGTFHAAR